MSQKKNILSVVALICAVASLAVSVLAFFGTRRIPEAPDDQLLALQQENAHLQEQIDELKTQLEYMALGDGLSGWTLSTTAWEDGTGADVTLTATPANYQEGMTAAFSVRLEGQEVSNIPCTLEDGIFTATTALTADDGYGYYCILVDAAGSRQQIPLTTPENPVEDIPVYLKDSLSSYCNMLVDSWLDTQDTLTLTSAYIQVQLPRISRSTDLTVTEARLVLQKKGEEARHHDITLNPGVGRDSYELELTDTAFSLPEMVDDDYLDLWLEVTLSDGQTLSASGASWYKTSDGLFLVVG